MSEYNIYVHAGLPKAASTTLQKHLFEEDEALLNMGVYPTCNVGNDTLVKSLNSIFLKDHRVKEFYSRLVNSDELEFDLGSIQVELERLLTDYDPNKNKKVVFSDEKITSTFFSHPDVGLKARRISKIFPDAKVILVLREQVDWIASQYRDHPFDPRGLDIGRPVSIEKWIDIALWSTEVKLFSMLSYNELIGLYEDLFGEENVCVLLFEELVDNLPHFSNKLSEFLGVDNAKTLQLLKGKRENIGVSAYFNTYRAFKRKYLTFGILGKIYKGNVKYFVEKLVSGGEKQVIDISPQYVNKLSAIFSEGNSLLNNRRNLGMEKYGYMLRNETLL